jgi:hypothetical protein
MAPTAGDLRLLARLDETAGRQRQRLSMTDCPTIGKPEDEPMSADERTAHDDVVAQLGTERAAALPASMLLRALRAWSWEEHWADSVVRRVNHHIQWRTELQIDAMITSPKPELVERHRLWRTLWCSDMYTRDSLGHPVTVQRVRAAASFLQLVRVWTGADCADCAGCCSWERSTSSRSSSTLTSTRRCATSDSISS